MRTERVPSEPDLIQPESWPMAKLDLPNFRRALRNNPDAMSSLSDMSYRRYMQGDFPAAIRWLLQYPDLLIALATDAPNLGPDDLERLARDAKERSSKVIATRERRKTEEPAPDSPKKRNGK